MRDAAALRHLVAHSDHRSHELICWHAQTFTWLRLLVHRHGWLLGIVQKMCHEERSNPGWLSEAGGSAGEWADARKAPGGKLLVSPSGVPPSVQLCFSF